MYTSTNFKSKKELKMAVDAFNAGTGRKVTVFQPNKMTADPDPTEGTVFLEGPHYPQPHKWYAQATLKAGAVVKVK